MYNKYSFDVQLGTTITLLELHYYTTTLRTTTILFIRNNILYTTPDNGVLSQSFLYYIYAYDVCELSTFNITE